MEEILTFLNNAGVYFIATVGQDGKPHNRPFGSRAIVDGKFYIFMGFPKPVYEQVLANPYVELVAMGKEREWIRISAKTIQESDLTMRRRILESAGCEKLFKPEDEMAFELTEVTAHIYNGQDVRTITW